MPRDRCTFLFVFVHTDSTDLIIKTKLDNILLTVWWQSGFLLTNIIQITWINLLQQAPYLQRKYLAAALLLVYSCTSSCSKTTSGYS